MKPFTGNFSEKEWQACIKVLSALKDNPFENPDNKTLSALITKIYKSAKKVNKKKLEIEGTSRKSFTQKKIEDIQTNLETTIAQNATNGETLYWDEKTHKLVYKSLNRSKKCYACQQSYDLANSFYTRMCPDCAEENYEKRFQNVDLTGRKVILTGGRVKIGYATALKFLRSGANLVLTTRFPALAIEQFEKEEDYSQWKDNLFVYGLDLRNLNAISEFIQFYKSKFDSLDILVNNAAQTIKYTDEYYLPLIRKEEKLLELKSGPQLIANKTPISHEVKALAYDFNQETSIKLNRFGQPIDNRNKTSWNSTLEEISMYELIEVNLINQIAPYFLIKELKPLMEKSCFEEKFIINVTSSEGMFSYSNKTIYHPHTNMTKAALNMMTLTSAKEFASSKIYMNSVDVGWVSTGATESLRQKQFDKAYIPPLDPVDGASRIIHPIVDGIKKNILFGKLLKNYKINEW